MYQYGYVELINEHFSRLMLNLSAPDVSNFMILQQVLYARELKPDAVVIHTADINNIEWVKGGDELKQADIFTCDYKDIESPIKSNPNYNPSITSESLSTLNKHLRTFNVQRLRHEPYVRIIRDYHSKIIDSRIKLDYHAGLIVLAWTWLCESQIVPIVLSDPNLYDRLSKSIHSGLINVQGFEPLAIYNAIISNLG